MKKIFNILIISLLLISCAANKPSSNNGSKEIVILTVNDMHGHIERMPRLGFVADSLRELYPNLLIFSAGDNRTGNSYNDFYPNHSNYPMIKLMNEIGFDLSAIGNHEFDKDIGTDEPREQSIHGEQRRQAYEQEAHQQVHQQIQPFCHLSHTYRLHTDS